MSDDEKAITEIRAAATGLLYPSESDEPFDLAAWPPAPSAAAAVAAHTAPAEASRQTTLDSFFVDLQQSEDWPRFQHLREMLEQHLRDVTVFRVGVVRVQVYVLGRLPSGAWLAVHTVSVET